MFLWHPNGRDRIEFTRYKLGMGFHEVWIPVEEADDETDEAVSDCVATDYVALEEEWEDPEEGRRNSLATRGRVRRSHDI